MDRIYGERGCLSRKKREKREKEKEENSNPSVSGILLPLNPTSPPLRLRGGREGLKVRLRGNSSGLFDFHASRGPSGHYKKKGLCGREKIPKDGNSHFCKARAGGFIFQCLYYYGLIKNSEWPFSRGLL